MQKCWTAAPALVAAGNILTFWQPEQKVRMLDRDGEAGVDIPQFRQGGKNSKILPVGEFLEIFRVAGAWAGTG